VGSSNTDDSIAPGANQGNVTPPAVVAAAISAAVAVAKTADAVVLGLGLCGDNYGGGPPGEDSTCFKINEAESTDRSSLVRGRKEETERGMEREREGERQRRF
jgi:hypothetical protein